MKRASGQPGRRAAGVLSGLGVVLVMCGASPAMGVRYWSAAVRLSPSGQESIYAHAAVDGRGRATVVWMQGFEPGSVIVARAQDHRARWGAARVISERGRSARFPELAVNRRGAGVAVWELTTPGSGLSAIAAAQRSGATAPWSAPVVISAPSTTAFGPQVTIDASGRAWAIWLAGSTQHPINTIDVSEYRPDTRAWSPLTVLQVSSRPLLDPQIAADPTGDLVAVWKEWLAGAVLGPRGSSGLIHGATRTAGRSWSTNTLGRYAEAPGQGSASFEFPGPQVTIDSHDRATVLWQAPHAHAIVIASAGWTPAHGWKASVPIAPGFWPHLASTPAGGITAAWESPQGTIQTASTTHAAGRWTHPVRLSAPGENVAYPHVAVDPRGDALIAWSLPGGPLELAARLGRAGPWRSVGRLGSTNAGAASLAFTPTNTALVVWGQPAPPEDSIISYSSHPAHS